MAADLAVHKSQQSHSAWVELSKEIANDPHALFITILITTASSRVLRDEVNQWMRYRRINGCKRTEGRWAGKELWASIVKTTVFAWSCPTNWMR